MKRIASAFALAVRFSLVSKRFGPLAFKGSTQEPPPDKGTARQGNRVCFDSKKAANDPAAAGVPDPVGSGVFVIQRVAELLAYSQSASFATLKFFPGN
jgi:hypothetical protein